MPGPQGTSDIRWRHMKRVGKAIQAARKAANLSQPVAAEALGVSVGAVRSWEYGRREAPAEARLKMVALWGADPVALAVDERNRCPHCGRPY